MPPLDSPLKTLILAFSKAFAEWLLGKPVEQIRPLNVELLTSTVRSDLLFEVVQSGGHLVLLHIELQGRRNTEPMGWRMLDYMSRVARRELGDQQVDIPVRLHSVVIYTGTGAGATDTGEYQIRGVDDTTSLAWRYEPVLLWRMEAEDLLKLGQPAFLALVGQTRLREPEKILPEVVAQIRAVADLEQRGRLLTALTSLISDKEALEMVEKIIERDELLDTPYLRRIREESWEEGLKEGTATGRAQGKEEGLELGRLEGIREAVLETVTIRFNPPAVEYRKVDRQLRDLVQQEQLQQALTAAIQAETMAVFTDRLAEIAPAE